MAARPIALHSSQERPGSLFHKVKSADDIMTTLKDKTKQKKKHSNSNYVIFDIWYLKPRFEYNIIQVICLIILVILLSSPIGESWSPQNHSYPEKMFPSNILISLEAEKNPFSLIENPHKSLFRKFFYDHSKVELFSFLCSNFYKKILSITRQRKDATAVAQLTLFLNARVSYHKCHMHKLA